MLSAEDQVTPMMAQQEVSPASPVNIDETPQHTLERIFGKCDAKFIQSEDGANLLDRFKPLEDWLGDRLAFGLDPYAKATEGPIVAETVAYDRAGRRFQGVNFASQDYLSLASHPAIKQAAIEAIERVGVHSAGSAALMGLTTTTLELERTLAAWLGYRDATVFPIAWAAGYGVIRTLVRTNDHIVLDQLSHACLMEGARAATPNVHVHRHLSVDGIRRRLSRIRAKESETGILVVTESLFSMDSDSPDMNAILEVCREFGAQLLVDCAHDLGSSCDNGFGFMGQQGVLGKADVVIGSFSKSFASNGGFIATNHLALKLALRLSCGPQTFTNAISPLQSAVVLKAIQIIQSQEGRTRREQLHGNIVYLRECLSGIGFEALGQPSPIVSIVLGNIARSRLITRFTLESGALVNLVEYPAVAVNACRLRLQVMADHTREHIDRLVNILAAATQRTDEMLAGMNALVNE